MDTAITDIERSADAEQDLQDRQVSARHSVLSSDLRLQVCTDIEAIGSIWRELETQDTSTVYQRHDWAVIALSTLERECGARPFIVAGHIEDRPAFLLPLVVKRRIYPTVQWIGGSHVNLCMGLYSREFLSLSTPGDIEIILRKIGALSNAYVMRLCCQPESWNGHANPMAALERQPSINPAFVMHLSEGFETLLKRGNAKRKKKKFRSQCRQAESAGGYKFIVADNPKTVTRLLEAFFRQKGERLRKSGIHNVFNTAGAREMLSTLALSSLGTQEPLLRMHALEIGGKVRAVFGGGIRGRHLSGYFSSISEDELSDISPGEMLLYLLAEHYCAAGMETMDLGAGDERYKRSWCDERQELFDVIVPVGAMGAVLASAEKLGYRLRRTIRSSPQVWDAITSLRRARARFFWR